MSIQNDMETLLDDAMQPSHLEVINESHMHNVPPGSESHFKVVIVSDHFLDESAVQRHRLVNGALAELLKEKIHALAIHCYSADEWAARNAASPDSPKCQGGSKL